MRGVLSCGRIVERGKTDGCGFRPRRPLCSAVSDVICGEADVSEWPDEGDQDFLGSSLGASHPPGGRRLAELRVTSDDPDPLANRDKGCLPSS